MAMPFKSPSALGLDPNHPNDLTLFVKESSPDCKCY